MHYFRFRLTVANNLYIILSPEVVFLLFNANCKETEYTTNVRFSRKLQFQVVQGSNE